MWVLVQFLISGQFSVVIPYFILSLLILEGLICAQYIPVKDYEVM